MAQQLIECVPNFSEGNDLNIIKQITNEIEKVDGVRLLNVDPGKATNRTVVTIVGEPAKRNRSRLPGHKKSRRVNRHEQTQRRAPPHGRHRCLSADTHCQHQHGRNRKVRTATRQKGRRRTQHPRVPLRSRPAQRRQEQPVV